MVFIPADTGTNPQRSSGVDSDVHRTIPRRTPLLSRFATLRWFFYGSLVALCVFVVGIAVIGMRLPAALEQFFTR